MKTGNAASRFLLVTCCIAALAGCNDPSYRLTMPDLLQASPEPTLLAAYADSFVPETQVPNCRSVLVSASGITLNGCNAAFEQALTQSGPEPKSI